MNALFWRGLLNSFGKKADSANEASLGKKITNNKPKNTSNSIFLLDESGRTIEIPIKIRANSRRIILRIDRKNNLPCLTIPPRTSKNKIEQFIFQYKNWIFERIAVFDKKIAFFEGAEIPIRGAIHIIRHSLPFRGETQQIEQEDKRFLIVHGASEQIETRVKRFLLKEAEQDFKKAVAHYADILGVSYGKITIKDTISRWGSCAANGDLSFSWRLILAPTFVLNYLAAHEVSHRVEMNHSLRYWRVVAKIYPEFKTAEKWLKLEGRKLHLYGNL